MPTWAAARPDGRQDLPAELFAVPHSLSSDGATVVAGERWSDSALVYAHTEAGWRLQGRLTPQVKEEHTCGLIHDVDGDTIAISEYVPSTGPGTVGRVWIYRRSEGDWTLEQKLAPSGSAYRGFGASVAISGDTLLVGAPETTVGDSIFAGVVYAYTRSGTRWTQRAKLRCDETNEGGTFGDALALQGSTAVVAASQMDWGGNNNAGQVFVFTGGAPTGTSAPPSGRGTACSASTSARPSPSTRAPSRSEPGSHPTAGPSTSSPAEAAPGPSRPGSPPPTATATWAWGTGWLWAATPSSRPRSGRRRSRLGTPREPCTSSTGAARRGVRRRSSAPRRRERLDRRPVGRRRRRRPARRVDGRLAKHPARVPPVRDWPRAAARCARAERRARQRHLADRAGPDRGTHRWAGARLP